jgi:nitrogen fixation protein FixH
VTAHGAPAGQSPNLIVSLAVSPKPVSDASATTFTIRLTDAKGHPVSGAAVSASLVMTDMDMGRNVVNAKPKSPGVYAGTGQFTMSGSWNVVVTASKGTEKSVKTFPFAVK